jgi:flagellar protein FlgJ
MMAATHNITSLPGMATSKSDREGLEHRRAKLREAAQGFEEMLLNRMYQEMFPNEDEEGGFFGEGAGSGTYQQLFINELAKITAASGQLGLTEMVERDVAARAGLTEESSNKRTEPIPGTTLGRPLPIPYRRTVLGSATDVKADPTLANRALQSYNEIRFSLQSPVKGRISSPFGERNDPFTGNSRQHKGLDIAAPAGTKVSAAASGTVAFSGWKPGYGNTVIIEHGDGYETRYAHNSDLTVRKGDTVTAGDTIAKVGSTGRSTGPHLHFELRQDGSPVDPGKYLARN